MLPLDLFRRPDFTGAQIAAFAISASFFALFLYTTLYLQEILHLSPIQAGLVYLPGTVLIFIVSGASAALASKVPPSVLVGHRSDARRAGLALTLLAQADSSWTALMPGLLVAASAPASSTRPSLRSRSARCRGPERPRRGHERRVPPGRHRRRRRGVRGGRPGRVGARRRLSDRLRLGDAHCCYHRAALAAAGAVACARLFRVGLASSTKRLAEAAAAVASR